MGPYATFTSQRVELIDAGHEENTEASNINDISALASRLGNKMVAVAEKPSGVSPIKRGNLIDTSFSCAWSCEQDDQ